MTSTEPTKKIEIIGVDETELSPETPSPKAVSTALGSAEAVPVQRNKYGANMPQRLRDDYNAAAEDSELLSLRQDIALIETGIQDALRRMSSKDPGELWVRARGNYRDLVIALQQQDDRESTRLMRDLGQVLEAQADIVQTLHQQRARVGCNLKSPALVGAGFNHTAGQVHPHRLLAIGGHCH